MNLTDLEIILHKVKEKYGDIQIKAKDKEIKEIQDISVYEIEGFNYLVIGVDEDDESL